MYRFWPKSFFGNFVDFLQDYEKEQILALKGKMIEINGLPCFIQDIKLESKLDVFTLITDKNINLKCKTEDLTQIEKKILKEEIWNEHNNSQF